MPANVIVAPGTTSLGLPGTGLTTISFDPADALSSYRFDANVNGDILRKGWSVNEKITTLFVKGDIGGDLFGIPVRGNIGVRYVKTKQSATGYQATNGGTEVTESWMVPDSGVEVFRERFGADDHLNQLEIRKETARTGIAATLAAGLAGVQEGLAPTAVMQGNGYEHTHDLPRSFHAAHEMMAASASCGRPLHSAVCASRRCQTASLGRCATAAAATR